MRRSLFLRPNAFCEQEKALSSLLRDLITRTFFTPFRHDGSIHNRLGRIHSNSIEFRILNFELWIRIPNSNSNRILAKVECRICGIEFFRIIIWPKTGQKMIFSGLKTHLSHSYDVKFTEFDPDWQFNDLQIRIRSVEFEFNKRIRFNFEIRIR